MTITINGVESLFPEGFSSRAGAVIDKARLRGDFEFIATGEEEFLCKQIISLRINSSYVKSSIVRYFDFCANTITTSASDHTDLSYRHEAVMDTVVPLNILTYTSLPETHPYRKNMDVLRGALEAGLAP